MVRRYQSSSGEENVRYKRNTGLELSPRDERHLICINRWASFATQSTFCRWSRTANDVAVLRLLVELVSVDIAVRCDLLYAVTLAAVLNEVTDPQVNDS